MVSQKGQSPRLINFFRTFFRIFKFNLGWRTQFSTKKFKITYKTPQLY